MHKSFSGDNVTCRRAVSTCQADFSSLFAPILQTYLKDLHSLLLSYLNSRNCHCFPLVPNIFTFFFTPSVLHRAEFTGSYPGKLWGFDSAQTESEAHRHLWVVLFPCPKFCFSLSCAGCVPVSWALEILGSQRQSVLDWDPFRTNTSLDM